MSYGPTLLLWVGSLRKDGTRGRRLPLWSVTGASALFERCNTVKGRLVLAMTCCVGCGQLLLKNDIKVIGVIVLYYKRGSAAVFARKTHTYRYELVQPVTTSSDLRVCGSWHYRFDNKYWETKKKTPQTMESASCSAM